MNRLNNRFLVFCLSGLIFHAPLFPCALAQTQRQRPATPAKKPRAKPTPKAEARTRYKLKGKILAVDRQPPQVTVEHEAIPGYMEAMAMKFPLQDESLVNKLKPGDRIEATLVVWDNIGKWWLADVVVKK